MTLAENLLDLALKNGADCAEIYQSRSKSQPISFEANRLKQLESSEAEGIALRLWKNNRPGLAVAYGEIDPQSLVDKALALSDLNEPESIELNENIINIQPPIGKELGLNSLIEMGKESIETLRQAYPEVICNASFECEQESTLLMNTKGLQCQYQETNLSYFLGAEWIRGEDFLGVYDGEYTRDQLNPDRVINNILKRLQWAENNSDPPETNVPVLFTPNAVTMLWGTITSALNGKRVIEKSSPWSELQGKLVISDQLTLTQNPYFAPYTCPFDDEGTPTQELLLIQEGVLQQFYFDRTTARQYKTKTTGNGFRPSLSTYPNPSLVNLIVNQGKGTLEELITTLDEGLIVDQILGGGADISGEFSVNIDLGYSVKKGQVLGRVKDTMIAGNVYSLLKQLHTLGGDHTWSGYCYTPSLIVDGVSISC